VKKIFESRPTAHDETPRQDDMTKRFTARVAPPVLAPGAFTNPGIAGPFGERAWRLAINQAHPAQ